ncbi:uncharacterized protein [Lepeophtheirus salmonis]|uniref:uncharacterized protein isoform X1 n=2 Tax=Lepeophtheirus salmonis TaxID=72036 RepID=UPI001AEB3A72|nr:uncharacterized protein LOC121125563 isoform X2 [Lepeophtheirus salmonis]
MHIISLKGRNPLFKESSFLCVFLFLHNLGVGPIIIIKIPTRNAGGEGVHIYTPHYFNNNNNQRRIYLSVITAHAHNMPSTSELLRYDPTNNAVVPVKDKNPRRIRRPLAPHEEYTTKKKVEVKTTTNTERRIQRQVVLEDGRVLAKNDPEIIVDKVEDLETNETEQSHDDLPESVIRRIQSGTVSGKKVVKDSFRRTVNTRDVTENVHSTRVSKDLGHISKKALRNVLKNKEVTPEDVIRRSEVRTRERSTRQLIHSPDETKTTTYKAESRKKIVDTTDIHDVCHLENGKLKSETYKTETHEIFDDRRIPSDGSSLSGSKPSLRANDVQKYTATKRENFTEFYRSGEKKDDPLVKVGNGHNVTSEDKNIHRGITHDWTKMEEKIRRNRRIMNIDGSSRTDVVTKKPLNYAHEEKNRRTETDKWLDEHFGSDWSLTNSSNTSQKNKKKSNEEEGKTIRRTMSFSSVHNPNMSRLVKQTTKTYDPVSGEEKVTYATMSRIDPAVNASTLSLPITRIDVGSSSGRSGSGVGGTTQRQEEVEVYQSPPIRRQQFHYINKDTENSLGSTYVTNFRAVPNRAVSTASSSGTSEKNAQHVQHVNIEVKSGNSPPLIHDRIQRLRTEHSSRSRNKKVTSSSINHSKQRSQLNRSDEEEHQRGRHIEDSKTISSSTSQINQIHERSKFSIPIKNKANNTTTLKYRSKSSQPLYRTELRREQYYPLENRVHFIERRPKELEIKIHPTPLKAKSPLTSPQFQTPPQIVSQNSTTKYIQIEPKSYRSLERTDGVESPSAIHNIPLRKFVSEERNHYYYDRKNDFIHSTPIKKAMSKPSGLDHYNPPPTPPPALTPNRRKQFREQFLLESKTPLRNHHPGAEYMSPRKHMERSESEQTHRHHYQQSQHNTSQRTSRSVSNRPKYPEPMDPPVPARSKSKKPRGKNSREDRTHSFLVKTHSGGSSGNDASRKIYHEHPLVEAEVQRLDNSYNERILHPNSSSMTGGSGGVLSGILGKLSPNRRSVSTAKLNQISSNSSLNKFGGSARDLYFAAPPGSSPTARSFYETNDAQKFKTIIFLSGK